MNSKLSNFLHKSDAKDARAELLKSENYCSAQLPSYFDFTPLLSQISEKLTEAPFEDKKLQKLCTGASEQDDVNYVLYTNKDGRLSWRPVEIIHPVLYVILVHLITEVDNWRKIQDRFSSFENSRVERCSGPFQPSVSQKKSAVDILNYWKRFEQRSLELSLDYSVLYQTDISNCYASIYTHSISWALEGKEASKKNRKFNDSLGNKIDTIIRSGRRGETIGIPQNSTLSDFIAELVLGAIDLEITDLLERTVEKRSDGTAAFHILRYRDDYRIFADNDGVAEEVLRHISSVLQGYRLTLGAAKTFKSNSLISGAVKPDKMASINLDDIGRSNAKTLQKRLLRIHSYSLEYPGSRRIGLLLNILAEEYEENYESLLNENLSVCLAIIAELSFQSPIIFPFASRLISLLYKIDSESEERLIESSWVKLSKKVGSISNKGLLELWLQRIALPNKLNYKTENKLCILVENHIKSFFEKGGEGCDKSELWNHKWIDEAQQVDWKLNATSFLSCNPMEMDPVIEQKEVSAFLSEYR